MSEDEEFIIISPKLKALFSDFKIVRENRDTCEQVQMHCPRCKEPLDKLETDDNYRVDEHKNYYVGLCCPFCKKFIIDVKYFKKKDEN